VLLGVLALPPTPFDSGPVRAQSGVCPTQGVITTAVSVEGLNCTLSGTLTIAQSGSLSLQSTTLSINGTLRLNDTSSLSVTAGSIVQTGVLGLYGTSALSVTGGSSISMTSTDSTPYFAGSVDIESSTVLANGTGSVGIYGATLTISGSTLRFENLHSVALGGASTRISNCNLQFSQVQGVVIGGKQSASSVTTVGNHTTVSDLYFSSTAVQSYLRGNYVKFYGNQTIGISDSAVVGNLSTSAPTESICKSKCGQSGQTNYLSSPNSTISFQGGAISVVSSQVSSIAREYYGYLPSSQSYLTLNSTSTIFVEDSSLVAGQSAQSGTFKESHLEMVSLGNTTIVRSFVGSLSEAPEVLISSSFPGRADFLTISRSQISTAFSPGLVTLRSTFMTNLSESLINANLSTFKAFAYTLRAVDSNLLVQNFSAYITFGGAVSVGQFVNSTISGCPAYSCLTVTSSGSYSVSGWLLAKAVDSGTSQPVAGASVLALTLKVPLSSYSGTTNSSGWAKIPVLYRQQNATKVITRANYVVQASMGGSSSPQTQVITANVVEVVLLMAIPVNISSVNVQGQTPAAIASSNNLIEYQYVIPPAGQYALGNYIGAQYIPFFDIVSNSVPLSFRNNATNSEIDFSTVGLSGGSFEFAVVYPQNLTQTPISVKVDGNPSVSVTHYASGGLYYELFSMPSGVHRVALTYLPPNGNYQGAVQYPRFFPPVLVVLALIYIMVVGLGFMIVYVRRRDRAKSSSPQPAK
jgi:hypothetical protein